MYNNKNKNSITFMIVVTFLTLQSTTEVLNQTFTIYSSDCSYSMDIRT
jgi:hypothetical protein